MFNVIVAEGGNEIALEAAEHTYAVVCISPHAAVLLLLPTSRHCAGAGPAFGPSLYLAALAVAYSSYAYITAHHNAPGVLQGRHFVL